VLAGADAPADHDALMESTDWKSLHSDGWYYLLSTTELERLFDLPTDSCDYHDRSADPACADRLAEMRHRVARKLLSIERPLPRTWTY